MKEEILKFIKNKQAYISGEEISKHFNISRAGVWKQIQQLRKDGYDIDAVPHLGYRLKSSPDKLLPQEISFGLNTKIIGRDIHHFDSVDSTMDIAFRLGISGAREGAVVCAEVQKKGRGRMGRAWTSPKSKGICISIILRPKLLPNETAKLTLLSAVAVSEAIRDIIGLLSYIKWPNDILINEKKVGGILTEMDAEMDIVKFAVIGIGINVNTNRSSLPDKATSLKEEKGKPIPRVELLKEILRKIESLYLLLQKEGFSPIIERWRELSSTLGRRVKISYHKEYIEGEAIDVDLDGGLLIRNDTGFVKKIMAGDVVRVR